MALIDILAPLFLVGLAILVFLFVIVARRQRRDRGRVFRELANERAWQYLQTDDGTAQSMAEGFDEFAQFYSPSLGDQPPTNVVLGTVDEGNICVFLNGTRKHEGDARLWTVCILETPGRLGPEMRIRPRNSSTLYQIGSEPMVPFGDDAFEKVFEVRAPDPEAVRTILDASTRDFLLAQSERTRLPVEIQVRNSRLAAYLARRNDEAKMIDDLNELVEFARSLSRHLPESRS